MKGIAAIAALAASGFIANPAVHAQGLTATVMQPWTSGGEAAAVAVFAEKFEAAGGTWIDDAIAGNDAMHAAAVSAIMGGTPPTAAHYNTGRPFEELVEAGLLRDVEAIASAEGWRDVLPQIIVDAIEVDGKIMAVPINLQTETWMWYSTEVLEKSGVTDVPETWPQFFEALDKVRAAGYLPFAWGSNSFWDRFIFQKVLASAAGPDLYLRVMADRDPAALRDPRVIEALDNMGRLRGYVDSGMAGRLWNDATNLVITNKAAFQLMGDWAKGEFTAAGLTPGVEYGCTLFPGEEIVVMSGDIFVLPKVDDPNVTAAQDLLAHVLFAKDTQLEFNIRKGSNPIRNDVDVSSMDTCAQHAADVQTQPGRLLPNPQFVMSNDMLGAMSDVITKFWNTPSMTTDEFATEIEAAWASAE